MASPSDDQPTNYPSLSIDWEVYAAMLDDYDATPEEQRELIETLWSIVVTFVDLGFEVNASLESCAQADNALSDDPPDLLSLLEQEWVNQAVREEDA